MRKSERRRKKVEKVAMNTQQVHKHIAELTRLINDHDHLYYVLDSPVISDAEFDALRRELNRLEAEYPQLVIPDSPNTRAGRVCCCPSRNPHAQHQ
jgi:DNA ligase (NAD+)